jgi:UDPglucose 6-dehydrogenase
MQLAVVGTGYVGLVAGAGFADFGNDVACVDVSAAKIEMLKRGEVPIYEPGLDVLIAKNTRDGRLRFSTDVAGAIRDAEIVFIAVGTPQADDGSADLSAVEAVGETIGKNLNNFKVIATKSTVPVGTADRLRQIIGANATQPFAVASNPEFLKEGDAVNDFMKPDRVIIGSDDPKAREILRHLYNPFVRASDRIQLMDARSAELTKYAANARCWPRRSARTSSSCARASGPTPASARSSSSPARGSAGRASPRTSRPSSTPRDRWGTIWRSSGRPSGSTRGRSGCSRAR